MKALQRLLLVAVMLFSASAAYPAEEVKEEKPLVQVAILLDTSNSMDGLIDQAKSQIWNIINEFALAEKNGMIPDLRVALYEYGNNNIPSGEGHIRMVLPLTNNLDKISEELFALTTNGGNEYCGMVIKAATEGLEWSESNDVYKAIFIAGNEPFTQGTVDYKSACEAAIAKGIIVNTIHCGTENAGIDGKWKDGAELADGKFMIIDQDRRVVHIDAPQDKEIASLSEKLNDTYIPYGAEGEKSKEMQKKQDKHAAVYGGGNLAQRAVAKSSRLYTNESWDLVDAIENETVKLDEVKEEDLPENMQKMTSEERKKYIQTQLETRRKIQNEIQELNTKRKIYVAEEMKKLSEKGEDTLGVSIINAIREQAAKKDFKFEKE